MSVARGWGAWLLGVGLGLGGCVLEVDEEPAGACDGVQCSLDGYCRGGDCYCNSGFLGNPYALRGCQSTRPGSGCTTTCGLNAYCEDAACVCEQGFVAVCGTGDCLALRQLCDGRVDCPNSADESPDTCAPEAVQQWTLTDECDDGANVLWRLWSRDRDWAWPGPDSTFVTEGLGWPSHEEVECLQGELICFGAQAGDRVWGVGVDGTGQCDSCCYRCLEESVDLGGVACE